MDDHLLYNVSGGDIPDMPCHHICCNGNAGFVAHPADTVCVLPGTLLCCPPMVSDDCRKRVPVTCNPDMK